ncbi:hypothetical protein HanRHA438_Chr07g0320001 [Helianthus annuus]|uniref:Uncharacterized protein n=1 Tax=Helianthus annuus TaxID=4232 RepID=A0A251UDP5_HELAN|nr:hypothetical protein HanXRQr2_Chr07g0310871 [Helianthus annuus]KAJ0909294.1 hypothetical protein HanRHA438_Chr07g0320001 [Helianthus annuus]
MGHISFVRGQFGCRLRSIGLSGDCFELYSRFAKIVGEMCSYGIRLLSLLSQKY